MAILNYRDPKTGEWVPLPTVGADGPPGPPGPAGADGAPGPAGADGATGPAGPSAVSTDANNSAILGKDGFIWTPDEVLIASDAPPDLAGLDLWLDPNGVIPDASEQEVIIQPNEPSKEAPLRLWVDLDATEGLPGSGGGLSEAEADARYVNVTGDTMTGPLSVLTPTVSAHAATKQYVDDRIVISATRPANPAPGTIWVPEG